MNLSCLQAQEVSQSIVTGEIHSLHSKILEEDRAYWVHLPPDFKKEKNYPIVYLLDGADSFTYASGIIDHLSAVGKIPELIMISILSTNRERDYTPTHIGADTTDKNFIADLHPNSENVWIVGGGSGHGFKHGPTIGEHTAKRIMGETADEGYLATFNVMKNKFS